MTIFPGGSLVMLPFMLMAGLFAGALTGFIVSTVASLVEEYGCSRKTPMPALSNDTKRQLYGTVDNTVDNGYSYENGKKKTLNQNGEKRESKVQRNSQQSVLPSWFIGEFNNTLASKRRTSDKIHELQSPTDDGFKRDSKGNYFW